MARTVQPARATIAPAPAAQPAKNGVNWLNIGLMIIACGAAIAAPFHTFLFAYIVLGPLHYLTEISWLHDRNYFARRGPARRWWLALVLFTILVLGLAYWNTDPATRIVSPQFGTALVCLVFAGAAAATYLRDWKKALGLVAILAIFFSFFGDLKTFAWAFIAVSLLTTIVHVFLFTGAFILFGALKSRSWVAVLSLGVFVCCAIAALALPAPFAPPTDRVRQLYTGFEFLNKELLLMFGRSMAVYEPLAIGIMRLIAFAYLYHYLNWFSKTSIIKWHEVPRARAVAILASWLAGGALYLYDFRIGLGVFYLLSLLHVFLEFPLNHQTLVDIGKAIGGFFRPVAIPQRPAKLAN
jgi:hypothetical protein